MINGDTLTSLNFKDFINYHKKNGAIATIALKKRNVYIDFGIVELDSTDSIKKYIEKPTIDHLVSMGVYVFEPRVLEYIRTDEKLDFPDLIKTLISNDESVKGFVFDGYWLDIGRSDDYEKANEEIERIYPKIL
jgi:NDP-mannose synthase